MTMPRETGAEKSEATCPNCGGPVGVVETAYGSTTAAPCPSCYPSTPTQTAAELGQEPPRELGSPPDGGPDSDPYANEGSQGGEL